MRIAFTSDLHVDVPGNATLVRDMAARLPAIDADVLIIGGDVSSRPERDLSPTLELFRSLRAVKLFVAGNHDLWVTGGPTGESRRLYYRVLPALARRAGFTTLTTEPVLLGTTAFVGTAGWYDHSFAPEDGSFRPEDFAAGTFDGLVWQDRIHARFLDADGHPMDDPAVADMFAEDLESQIDAALGAGARTIVAVTHHVAFPEMLPPATTPRAAYFRTFLGSARLGRAIAASGACVLALAGHIHDPRDLRIHGLRAVASPLGYPSDRSRVGDADGAGRIFVADLP